MKQLEKIYNSTLKFLVPKSPDETYMIVTKEAVKLVGAKDGSIFLPKLGNSNEVERIYTTNKDLYKIKVRKDGVTNTAYKSGVPKMLQVQELTNNHPQLKKLGYSSDITIPLTYSHITIGVLSVLSGKNKNFTEEELDILRYFTPLATLAIRNSHLTNELQNAINLRDLFISMAAHEFKNPLSVISLATQVIDKRMEKGEAPRENDIVMLRDNVEKLTAMIDELMNVSHIKQGKLRYDMEKINLVDLLKDTVNEFRKTNTQHKISLKKQISNKSYVMADKNKLFQAIINILNNAAKFSPEGSAVKCEVVEKDGNFYVRIKDQGEGIPEKELPRIFEHFYRGESVRKTKSGMGIGLFLVKSIIDHHQGEISIKSKVNKGTTVTIVLPQYTS